MFVPTGWLYLGKCSGNVSGSKLRREFAEVLFILILTVVLGDTLSQICLPEMSGQVFHLLILPKININFLVNSSPVTFDINKMLTILETLVTISYHIRFDQHIIHRSDYYNITQDMNVSCRAFVLDHCVHLGGYIDMVFLLF